MKIVDCRIARRPDCRISCMPGGSLASGGWWLAGGGRQVAGGRWLLAGGGNRVAGGDCQAEITDAKRAAC